MNCVELRKIAKSLGIKRYGSMRKAELLQAIELRRRNQGVPMESQFSAGKDCLTLRPPKASVERPPKASVERPPKASVERSPKASADLILKKHNVKDPNAFVRHVLNHFDPELPDVLQTQKSLAKALMIKRS